MSTHHKGTVAFYAPLKSPEHATPSGDREIGRRFLKALAMAGWTPEVVSHLRSYDRHGDRERQARLKGEGQRERARIIERYERESKGRRPRLWLTYHLYHKAPDWIGPEVTRHLGIPYVVAEGSVSPRQADGSWAEGYEAALKGLRQADLLLNLNSRDRPGLEAALGDGAPLRHLPPFLDTEALSPSTGERERRAWAERLNLPERATWLICVAMMRKGNKLASFVSLARALASVRVPGTNWVALIVGDGPASAEVQRAFDALPASRVAWLGRRDQAQVRSLLGAADLFVWPAVDEPLGMAMLEAQACGLPVVAGRGKGVTDIVRDGRTGLVVDQDDVAGFARSVERLIADESYRERLGRQARELVVAEHDLRSASRHLDAAFTQLLTHPAVRHGGDAG